ncbi:MAG: 3-phosphoglycerate dehydrogenase [Alphaproteobacteria bacterium]|nr:3-phosphoglycerate dehydrogenase [Alphaproteobacteria bacterium]
MARILTEPLRRALIVEAPHASLESHLATYGIEAVRLDRVPDDQALIDALRQARAQVLFKRSRVPVTRAVVEACPELQVVALCCIGDDSVDKEATADHGLLVVNDPVSNARSVVELAVAHMIGLSRRLYETDRETRAHGWDKSATLRFEVADKKLGIVGLGNIGRQVARTAEALGMDVAFFDTREVAQEVGQEMGWRRTESLQELFRSVDVVSVHTSAKDAWGQDNEGLLDPVLAELGADLPGDSPRIFLNLARGNLHSAQALLDAVASGAVRHAAVDVFPEEPSPGSPWRNPYADEPHIVCTPHIGAATQEAQPRIARRVARTVGELSRFGALRDCVYAQRVQLALPQPRVGQAVLAVVHSTERGTKKAVQDAIYDAEASTLASTQQDFPNGIAYDLSVLDRPLRTHELEALAGRAAELAKDPTAIRSVRQVVVPEGW